MKYKKGYVEFLDNSQVESKNNFSKRKIESFEKNDDWLINQIAPLISNELIKFNSFEEKIEYINNKFNFDLSENLIYSVEIKDSKPLKGLSVNESVFTNINTKIMDELKSSNELKIISPFITRSMIGQLKNTLDNHDNLKLKILTTTYDGLSQFLDIEALEEIWNKYPDRVDVKIENVNPKDKNSRIHAKTYIFIRENKFSSAIIGSSNFTKTGLETGKENNIKISEFREFKIFNEITNRFNELWNMDKCIEINNMDFIKKIKEIKNAYKSVWTKIEKNDVFIDKEIESLSTIAPIKPRNYQKKAIKILNFRIDKLHKNKHLLVMATGTGKTALAAFFYKELQNKLNREPSVLYIAGQEELIEQTRETFGKILNKGKNFGVPFYGGKTKDIVNERYVFSSFQTLKNNLDQLKDKKFDLVIFDEAHHIRATSYKKIYNIVSKNDSTQILGLTATPKRTENFDVKDYFFDGEYAYELNLNEAIDKEILSDFDYFYIKDDSISLEGIDLTKKDDEEKLEIKLSETTRNEFVYKKIKEYIGKNNEDVSAVLFCVSQKHANKISNYLIENGENAAVLTSDITDKKERKQIIDDFKNKKINFLCVVNIFNEGVDVPNIDNILLLRPTTSLIVYLQQLGRGLRKYGNKRLQIFDFINNIDMNVNKNYNYFNFMSQITKNGMIDYNQWGKNFDFIDQLAIGDSTFIFEKSSKEFFQKQISKLSSTSIKKSILDSLEKYWNENNESYEYYEEFIVNNFESPFEMYEKIERTFLRKNNILDKNSIIKNKPLVLKSFSSMNNKFIIKKFIEIIENKNKIENEKINDIFFVTLFYNKKNYVKAFGEEDEIKWNLIFNNSEITNLFDEILLLLKYKLLNEPLIDNEVTDKIESFIGTYLTKKQIIPLMGMLFDDKGKLQTWSGGNKGSGVVTSALTSNAYFQTSYKTRETKFGYVNDYDRNSRILSWDSQENIKKEYSAKIARSFKERKIYVFYKSLASTDLYPDPNLGMEFLGYIEDIISERESDDKRLISFQFKIAKK